MLSGLFIKKSRLSPAFFDNVMVNHLFR